MNLPTKLTLLRVLMIPLFIVFFFVDVIYFKFAAMFVFVLASFTDYLDGHIARKQNIVTDLGKFLDPIADKMLVACALIAVCFYGHSYQIAVFIGSMIIICRELFISGFRIVASSKNVVLAADRLGKIKTVFQMCSLTLLIPYGDILKLSKTAGDIILYISLILFAIAILLTIVSAINYLVKNKNILKDIPKI